MMVSYRARIVWLYYVVNYDNDNRAFKTKIDNWSFKIIISFNEKEPVKPKNVAVAKV